MFVLPFDRPAITLPNPPRGAAQVDGLGEGRHRRVLSHLKGGLWPLAARVALPAVSMRARDAWRLAGAPMIREP
jgi:hypothetical protein